LQLLTGATGSLGAHILADLVSSSLVAKVICLSRARSHEDSLARVRTSFEQRSRTVSDWSKIESLSADINSDRLGLSSSEYEGLQRTVTAVICNHWPVNFNYSLASFAPHIQGAINLLNLTQTSADDARFYFSSSVGTSQGVPRDTIPETFSSDPATAGGMGYGQSKWVVEKIMERVGEKKGAKVGVFRIGQLVGDSQKLVRTRSTSWSE
jgi:thioester reductase-like protein